MPTKVADIDLLKKYISGVVGRADHHAKGVNEIALALVGAIVWKKDEEPNRSPNPRRRNEKRALGKNQWGKVCLFI